jgi:hypothetical protein
MAACTVFTRRHRHTRHTGDADAYGTIADCYTDLDQFEQAAAYYDKYINSMNGPV